MESRSYEKDGEKRTSFMINVSDIEFIEIKRETAAPSYEPPPTPPAQVPSLELNPEDYTSEDTGLLPFSLE